MKQAQPLGQKMHQARARLRPAVESGEKAMEALQKAQETFEQAQQEVVHAQMDPDELIQEAPLPVKPAPQVNVSLVKSLEALTGLIENMWNPEAGATTRSPDTGNAGVILQTSSVVLSQKGGAALDAEQDPDLHCCLDLLHVTPWETLASLLRPDVWVFRTETADHPG